MSTDEEIYYRWVLIDNQETCYTCVTKLLDGFFKTKEEVQEFYKGQCCFAEHLFSVKKLPFSAAPKWIVDQLEEQ